MCAVVFFGFDVCSITKMIELPWETEHIVESSKGQLVVDGSSPLPIVASLISSLKNPTQFAIVVTLDEEKPAETSSGFMAKMKSMANSAASHAVKMQRQVTATNRLSSVYDVKYVLPLCANVQYKIVGGSLVCSWKVVGGTSLTVKLSNLQSQFMNVFNATREISITKFQYQFIPKGTNGLFAWLWKYQPIQPLPTADISQKVTGDFAMGKVFCLTWNVAGLAPPDDSSGSVLNCSKLKNDLIVFLRSKLDSSVDVFLLCLQEASPLNAKNVMMKGGEFGELWIDFLSDCLDCAMRGSSSSAADEDSHHRARNDNSLWIKAAGTIQVGLVIAMFVRSSAKLSNPLTSNVKTGTLGLTGNKGCVALHSKVVFGSRPPISVSILNLHLASGEGKADFRKTELDRIVNESSFGEDKGIHFFDSNFCIVTGDLNSRVNDPAIFPDGLEICSEDELLMRIEAERDGFLFQENPVKFPATYKLVPGEDAKLIFAEGRKPGWCDRILFRSCIPGNDDNSGRSEFICTEYNSVRKIDFSDHTPVYALFALRSVEVSTTFDDDASSNQQDEDKESNNSDLYDK